MPLLEAVLLGVIQGLTEFLPVSSDGHLALAQAWLGMTEEPLTMTVLLHAGTLAVVVGVFRRELADAVRGGLRGIAAVARGRARAAFEEDAGARLALLVVVATIPTGVVGLLLEKRVEALTTNPLVIAGFLAVSGLAVGVTRFWTDRGRPVGVGAALAIGIVQGLAVLPGLSRSATTISMALALGVRREEAARFSFLASVPAVAGAVVLKLGEAVSHGMRGWAGALVGVLAAGVVGWLAVVWLLRLVKGGQFWWFALYLFPFAALVAALTLVRT